MSTKHFVNLTNGIEALPLINGEVAFIRIQSTACEQKRWDFILQELDYTFLMALALGHECVVYDYGARKRVPRAVYQGLALVQYTLNRRWFGRDERVTVRGNDATAYFRTVYTALDDRTMKRIDYFAKFLRTDSLHLRVVTEATVHDGDYAYFRTVLHEGAAQVARAV